MFEQSIYQTKNYRGQNPGTGISGGLKNLENTEELSPLLLQPTAQGDRPLSSQSPLCSVLLVPSGLRLNGSYSSTVTFLLYMEPVNLLCQKRI